MPSLKPRKILLGVPGSLALFSHFALAAPLLPNDNFADAELISGTSGTLNANNNGASREIGEPSPAGITSDQSVWYQWTAPSTGIWQFDTAGSNYNTVLGIYTGSVVASLTEIASNDDAAGITSRLTFAATAGTTYYIDVAGNGTAAGSFNLNWDYSGNILGGRITDAAGKPATNVQVALSGPQTASVTTDANGYYTSPALQSGNYTVTPAAPYLTFAPTSQTVDLTDSNSAVNFTSTVKPSISVSNATFAEGNSGTTNAVFTVKLSIPSALTVTVDYATQNGTALSPSDFTAATGTLTFAPGETTKTVTVLVNGDTTNEPDERFNLNLGTTTNATINDGLGVGTITNDDGVPAASVGNAEITEGDSGTKTLNFTVSLSAPSAKTVTVSTKTVAAAATANTDPATAGSDYVALPATLVTFAPGETSKTVSVTINGDTVSEQNETFNLNISAPSNATVATAAANGLGTITNDDATPSISISDVEVTEGNTGTVTAAFTVSLSPPSSKTVKVTVATADVSTTAGSDYTAVAPTVLTFTPGQTSKVVNVLVKGDLIAEATETFNVALTDASNATITKASGTGTIVDNDPKPSISVVAPSVVEGNSDTVPLPFVLKLSNPSSMPITVDVHTADAAADSATADSDYTALDTTVTFAPGETSKTVPVTVKGDLINEVNEKIKLVLSNPTNATLATNSIEGTIVNDDALPALSIDGATISEGNSGTKTLDFTVSLSALSGKTVTAVFKTANPAPGTYTATAGTDYVAVAGTTVTFAPGETSKKVSVTINGDETFEQDEKFNGTLSTPVNASIAQGTGVATITNDDLLPEIYIDPTNQDLFVAEGNSGSKIVPITFKLSAPSSLTVTVSYTTQDYSANAGPDYVAQSGTLTFTPGQTSKTINFVIKGDTVVESNEQFSVFLLSNANYAFVSPVGHNWYSYVNILDDDATPSISIDNPTISEGDSGSKTLNFTVSLSNPSGKTVTASFKTAASAAEPTYPSVGPFYPATPGTDYVAVPPATVSFAPGETSKTVSVVINGDSLYEFNEYFSGVLSSPVNATIAQETGQAIITNDDLQETEPTFVSVDSTSYQIFINEGDSGTKTGKVKLNLSAPRNFPITVTYSLNASSATEGVDFVAGQGAITFAPGETSKEVEFTVIGDTTVEDVETFSLLLENGPIGYNSHDRYSEIFIKDDDAPTVSIDSSTIVEGNSGTKTLNFTVSLSVPKETPVSVDFKTGPATLQPWMPYNTGLAKAGEDYVAIPTTTLTFAPGETSKTLSVTIKGDELFEFDELFNVELSNPTNGASIAQGSGGATIINDDEFPSTLPNMSIAPMTNIVEGNSGTKIVKVPVTLSAPMGVPVRVQFGFGAISASFDEDFVPQNQILEFEPGETTKDIEVTVNGDTTPESDERFEIFLYNAQGANISGPYGIVTILDDDTPPTLSIDSPTIVEGNSGTSQLNFTINLSRASTDTVSTKFQTGDYTLEPGTYDQDQAYPASAGEDYLAVPSSTVTFAPGETSKTVSVTIKGDETFEYNEKFKGVLSNPTNATIAQGTGFAFITNDDSDSGTTPSLSIAAETLVVEGDSGSKVAKVVVTLSAPQGVPVTVNYGIDAATAQLYSDFDSNANYGFPLNGTLTFAPGETTKEIEFRILGDTDPESDEYFSVFIHSSNRASIERPVGRVIIQDDDNLPKLSVDSPTINEGSSYGGTSQLNFVVRLSRASSQTVTTTFQTGNYTPEPGTSDPVYPAKANEDYIAVPVTTLTFAPGETFKVVPVTIIGDDLYEANERFHGLLNVPVNAAIEQATGTATITNDDAPATPTISLANYYFVVNEGDTGTRTAFVTVNLSEAVGIPVSVQYVTYDGAAISGEDYVGGTGTLTFEPGETTKNIEITINGDTEAEVDELFSVNLQYPQNAYLYDGNAVVVIINDDGSSARSSKVSGGAS